MGKITIVKIVLAAFLILIPLQTTFAQSHNFLSPNGLKDLLKQNITIPFDVPPSGEKLPTPDETLKKFSPQIQEFNKGVQEETGVDFAKFLRWITKVFTAIFRIITTILETFAEALGS